MDRLVEEALAKVNESVAYIEKDRSNPDHKTDRYYSNLIARAINSCKALISSLKSIS